MKADFESPPPRVFRPIVITIESEEERKIFQKALFYLLHYQGPDITGKMLVDLQTIQQDFFS